MEVNLKWEEPIEEMHLYRKSIMLNIIEYENNVNNNKKR